MQKKIIRNIKYNWYNVNTLASLRPYATILV